MTALVEYDDWETQVDNDNGLYIENIQDVESTKTNIVDKDVKVEVEVEVEVVKDTNIAKEIEQNNNSNNMISVLQFMKNIMNKNYATFLQEKKLPPYKKTIRCINVERDRHLARIDIIREIINGRAIIVKATIDWYQAANPKFEENSPILRDPCKWKIKTYQELYKIEAKYMSDQFGINTAPTKKQLRSRITK